jgi:hypothetical protein
LLLKLLLSVLLVCVLLLLLLLLLRHQREGVSETRVLSVATL